MVGGNAKMTRKLASIRMIGSISPIEGADNIELAHVDGWQCVVKKGEFIAGQLCVYFEIDSFLPIRPEKEGFRLRTIKLRGKISQGLAIPFHSFPGIECDKADILGSDVTELLGVLKYDPPIPAQLAGICKGNFPSFIRKIDQEHVQNLWHKIKDCEEHFEVTIKLDGSSCTYYLNDGIFGVCSRNLELKEDENNTFWKIAKRHDIESILRNYGKNIALQGEVIGEGIQGNPEKIKGQEFYLFDIWDIDRQQYLDPEERAVLWSKCLKDRGVCWCPYAEEFKMLAPRLSQFKDINELLDAANGKSLNSGMREGIVFKSMEIGSGLRFKVISNEYLLKGY
jgi:RNA ligase (TIGR02306 family)